MGTHFERYHCQMALPGFGRAAQERLQNAKVLIVGAGGLGCPAAQYLAAAGIGTIGIADDDVVSVSNLHRQILYTPHDVGLPKVEAAAAKLQQQNPAITIVPYRLRATSANAMALIDGFDLVIEGTDNFETKLLLNDACVLLGKPLVYGAIYQFEGQVSVWNVLQEDGTHSPNYRDVFPDAEKAQVPNCTEGGVIPSLAGIVGCMQANEAIKYLIGSEGLLAGRLWVMDVLSGQSRSIKLKKTDVHIDHLPEAVSVITLDELAHMEDGNYELIDVRNEHEHTAFNIGGMNIPLAELENQLPSINHAIPIVCYCATGKRSATAAALIKSRFPAATVYSLKNGMAKT
ncbi:ThiF family adenylyltransferase [Parapedobacter sp. 2B3]|uniref:ThiF family adenylyltransferase n=1 Tax=Parapedobacter sp. 2B3 TaxID=3342381 RepID=UPI0035B63B0E